MMESRVGSYALFICLVALLALVPCQGQMISGDQGHWPQDWPAELEPLRDRAETNTLVAGLGTDGIPRTLEIYQIPFQNRAEFERVWPAILEAKSPGGTLTLTTLDAKKARWPNDTDHGPPAAVRMRAPSRWSVGVKEPKGPGDEPQIWVPSDWTLGDEPEARLVTLYDEIQEGVKAGTALIASPPWPDSAHLPNGELAEYVVAKWAFDGLAWVPAELWDGAESKHRARTDIELVVDGNVIDLNRIHMPADTRIIDKRGLGPEGITLPADRGAVPGVDAGAPPAPAASKGK